jgi:hypothetical protein
MLERGKRHTPRRSTAETLAQALRLGDAVREVFLDAAETPPRAYAGRNHSPARSGYPGRITEDWREAHAALAAGLPKAAAAMARRAVYGVCVDGKATGSGYLCDLIEELGKASTLHPTLVEWALQIRLFSHTLEHPVDDGLDGVTRQEATTVVAFLDELLWLTYDVPDRLAKLKAGTTA